MRKDRRSIPAALLSLMLLFALAPAAGAEGGIPGKDQEENGASLAQTVADGGSVSLPAMGLALTPGSCTVNVSLVPQTNAPEDFAGDVTQAKVQADLYMLAAAEADEGYDSYHYDFGAASAFSEELIAAFNAALADEEDPSKQNSRDAMLKAFSPLAQEFAEVILSPGYTSSPEATQAAAAGASSISVTNLNPGLYLMVLRGSDLEKKEDPDAGYLGKVKKASGSVYGNAEAEIRVSRAFSPNYEYLFEPQLITVPTRVSTGENPEQQYNSAYGVWTDILNIAAKPERQYRNGNLRIIKQLDPSGTDIASFIFKIEWTDRAGKPQVRYAAITVNDGASSGEYLMEKVIPVNTRVSVTEINTGLQYSLSADDTETKTVTIVPAGTVSAPTEGGNAEEGAGAEADGSPATVEFKNVHDGPGGGHAVVNRFEKQEHGNYVWHHYEGSSGEVPADVSGGVSAPGAVSE